jgi:putative hydrolase of the HAD superfamily
MERLVVRAHDRASARSERVVFWDFDGTLASRRGGWRGALIDALTDANPNHHVSAADLAPSLQDGFPWHRPDIEHLHLETPDAWWVELTARFELAYLRAGVVSQIASSAAGLVRQRYCDPRHWTLFPDSRPVLEQLGQAGWRHVVVSNHVPELPELVSALGLDNIIESVVTSAHTGYEKPNPKMFAEAIRRAGAPRTMWMVGDSPTADIAGAEAVGIPAILVRTPNQAHVQPLTLHDAAAIINR